MSNIRLNWVLPTTRTSTRPLPVEEIKHWAIEVSLDAGANWTPLNQVAPPDLSLLVTDVEPGTWKFRGAAVDTADRAGAWLETSVTVADTSPPEIGVSFTGVVE